MRARLRGNAVGKGLPARRRAILHALGRLCRPRKKLSHGGAKSGGFLYNHAQDMGAPPEGGRA